MRPTRSSFPVQSLGRLLDGTANIMIPILHYSYDGATEHTPSKLRMKSVTYLAKCNITVQ